MIEAGFRRGVMNKQVIHDGTQLHSPHAGDGVTEKVK
jgi:hypothetical protein